MSLRSLVLLKKKTEMKKKYTLIISRKTPVNEEVLQRIRYATCNPVSLTWRIEIAVNKSLLVCMTMYD